MNIRFLALALLSLMAIMATQAPRAAGSTPVTVTVDADPTTPGVQASRSVSQGSTFYADILIGSVSDLQAFNFELVYDQRLLSAPTVTTGPDVDRNPDAEQVFLSSTGRAWSCSPPAPSGDDDPSSTVGAAFLSCYSTGTPAGPDVGSPEVLLAKVSFTAVAQGTSSLTLRNVNTFQAGGIETGSCNPVVITAATCTGAGITVSAPAAVGGIAELPEPASLPVGAGGSSGPSRTLWIAVVAGVVAMAALGAATSYARRRRGR